jgi:hypothetical protein
MPNGKKTGRVFAELKEHLNYDIRHYRTFGIIGRDAFGGRIGVGWQQGKFEVTK